MEKKSLIERFSAWYISLICKHQYKALLFYILLALAFAFPILVYPGLKLDADLAHLLPEKTPSVIALNESYERFGSTDRVMIAIQSGIGRGIAGFYRRLHSSELAG